MSKKITLFVLMLTIIIEAMGMGLILPLLPTFLASASSPFSISPAYYFLAYGVAMALFPVGLFFGTPYFGTLSDSLGRRKSLLACLIGNGLVYGLTVFSLYSHLLWLFFLLRLLSGFVSSGYLIAQAAAADISTKEERSKVMGWIACAYSIGLIVGPLITSSCGIATALSSSLLLPCGIASAVSFFCAVFLFFSFKETYQFTKKDSLFSLSQLFGSLFFIWKDPRVNRLGITFVIFQFGWNLQFQHTPLFLKELFSFTIPTTGFFFLVIACAYAFAFLIQGSLFKRFSLAKLFVLSTTITSLCILFTTIAPAFMQWILGPILSISIAMGYSILLGLFSNAVSEQEQGKIMGNLGAAGSIAVLLAAASIGSLSYLSLRLPFYLATLAFLASGASLFYLYANKKTETTENV